ncbi:MAG: gamma-butyrobetaine hydroxylase-like domain-containing protein [Cellvibrionaceae bacterium]
MNKPSKIHLHKKSKILELHVAGQSYHLPAEFLRVHSPSAEVKGHGPGQEKLVHGKIDVGISDIKITGNYGITIIFDDEHDSGIFSWQYLIDLCKDKNQLWDVYLDKLKKEQKNRDPHTSVVQFSP